MFSELLQGFGRKLKKWLIPIAIKIFLILLIPILIFGVAANIKKAFDNWFDGTFYSDSRRAMNAFIDTLSDEQMELLGISKKSLRYLLEYENSTYLKDQQVEYQYKVDYSKINYRYGSDIHTTSYGTQATVLPLEDMTYHYRIPWQFVYSIVAVKLLYEPSEYLDTGEFWIPTKYRDDVEYLKSVFEALKPVYEFDVMPKSYYSYSELEKKPGMSTYKHEEYSKSEYYWDYVGRDEDGNPEYDYEIDWIKYWDYYYYIPKAFMVKADTPVSKVTYNYSLTESNIPGTSYYNGGFIRSYYLTGTNYSENYERLMGIFHSYEIKKQDVKAMIEIIKLLPEGDRVIAEMSLQEILMLMNDETIIIPVEGEYCWPTPTLTKITDRFGPRILNGKPSYHYGLDIAHRLPGQAKGHVIVSVKDGVVDQAIWNSKSAGIFARIKHTDEDGTVTYSRYLHMSAMYIGYGDKVVQGQVIGRVGNTGNSFGAHLHLEIMDSRGKRMDPLRFIRPPG